MIHQVEKETVEREPVILQDNSSAIGVVVFLVLAIIMALVIAFSIGSQSNNSPLPQQEITSPAPQATPFVPVPGPPGPAGPAGPQGPSGSTSSSTTTTETVTQPSSEPAPQQ